MKGGSGSYENEALSFPPQGVRSWWQRTSAESPRYAKLLKSQRCSPILSVRIFSEDFLEDPSLTEKLSCCQAEASSPLRSRRDAAETEIEA